MAQVNLGANTLKLFWLGLSYLQLTIGRLEAVSYDIKVQAEYIFCDQVKDTISCVRFEGMSE